MSAEVVEFSLVDIIFKGIIGILTLSGGWLFNKTNKNSEDINKVRLDHAQYELEAERRYASQESIQSTMARLYCVLEEHRDESRQSQAEMRNDIKQSQAEMRDDIKLIMTRLNGHV